MTMTLQVGRYRGTPLYPCVHGLDLKLVQRMLPCVFALVQHMLPVFSIFHIKVTITGTVFVVKKVLQGEVLNSDPASFDAHGTKQLSSVLTCKFIVAFRCEAPWVKFFM